MKCSFGQEQWCICAWYSRHPSVRSALKPKCRIFVGAKVSPGQVRAANGGFFVAVCLHSLLTALEILDKFHFHRLKTYFQPLFFSEHSIFMKRSHKNFVSPKIRHFSSRESKTFLYQRPSAFQIKDITVLPATLKDSTILERTLWLKPLPPWNFCKVFSD